MRVRLYLDENALGKDFVEALRSNGVDVLTTAETGLLSATDERQLEHAATEGRTLYSYNIRDFIVLHYQYLADAKQHAGIILCEQERYSVGEQMRRVVRLAENLSAEQMHGRLEFLSTWGGED
jgi:hypothetical protein